MQTVEQSSFFRVLSDRHESALVREAPGPFTDGCRHSWILTVPAPGWTHCLAHVRDRGGRIECRTVDRAGQEHWLAVS